MINIAKKVYLINRGDELTGDKVLAEKVKASPRVGILNNANTTAILGDKFVKGIRIDQKGKEKEIDVQGVFVNIGYIPSTDIARDLVKLNPMGEIEIDSSNQTSIPGIFAAGDCTNVPYKQIITAAGEGAKASLNVFKYLAKKPKEVKT